MSEEELAIFDILTRPAPELTPEERKEVKKVARELLGRLKDLLVLNWRQNRPRVPTEADYRRYSRVYGLPAGLFPETVSAEVLGGVRTCL